MIEVKDNKLWVNGKDVYPDLEAYEEPVQFVDENNKQYRFFECYSKTTKHQPETLIACEGKLLKKDGFYEEIATYKNILYEIRSEMESMEEGYETELPKNVQKFHRILQKLLESNLDSNAQEIIREVDHLFNIVMICEKIEAEATKEIFSLLDNSGETLSFDKNDLNKLNRLFADIVVYPLYHEAALEKYRHKDAMEKMLDFITTKQIKLGFFDKIIAVQVLKDAIKSAETDPDLQELMPHLRGGLYSTTDREAIVDAVVKLLEQEARERV
ncbi:hypothetical protein J2Z23_004146 [Lederbergia galactosidilyticus]|uniref:hypothetical protein n=1 Tax=Lederbergia galactosidilytica TaxID=217031 RepID=UPI001AE81A18|nr:hypothetical protein [Lederbergia galactosidilytica]MBP1917161.1 hypothetical protein [Lederbergia galactosidilytica]